MLPLIVALLGLLVWIPGPASAGAKVIAWVWILYPVIHHFTDVIATGKIGDHFKASPNKVFFGGGAGIPIAAVASAYIAYVGYGLATLLGKNLEPHR